MDTPEGAPSLLILPTCCVGSYFLLIVEMFLGACCFTVTPWYRMMLLPSPTPTPPWIIPDEKKKIIPPVAWCMEMIVVTSGFVFGLCQTLEKPRLGASVTSLQMSRKAAIREQGEG